MQQLTTNTTIYVSDDGLKQSTDKFTIQIYEHNQRKEQFDKRARVKHICAGTSLYNFTSRNDLREFLKYHRGVRNYTSNYLGYFVYIDYDKYNVFGDNVLLELSEYTESLQQKIHQYNTFLAKTIIK